MKKILALLLALTMVFALAACGNTETKDPTESKPPVTESTDPTEETIDTAAKQAFYDTYFTSDKYKTAGNSFKATSDVMNMAQVMDKDGNGMTDITIGDSFLRIYKTEAGVYVNVALKDDETGEMQNVWMKYEEAEGENVLEENGMTDSTMPTLEDIVKVTYVETKDGVDTVKVEVPNEYYTEGVSVTEYTLKFTYEEQEYTVIMQESKDAESYFVMWDDENLPESLDMFDYKLDVENKKLVNQKDETASFNCEIVETKDITPPKTTVFDMYIDVETESVVKMGAEEDGVYTTLEFFNTEKFEPEVEFPAEAEACTAEALAMMMLAILFQSM